ncbi:UNVERIFIED_CONTAM: hypothetical protein Q9R58_22060 [Methylobacteriaceae bacterium AG10]|nr:hypothetical protein [Methylobacteriaceae bacterium AG10]
MNRRSVLRWLGLAPIAAPAAVAAASAPALPPIDYSALGQDVRLRVGTASAGAYIDLLTNGRSRVVMDADAFHIQPSANGTAPILTFDGETIRVPSLAVPRAAG